MVIWLSVLYYLLYFLWANGEDTNFTLQVIFCSSCNVWQMLITEAVKGENWILEKINKSGGGD